MGKAREFDFERCTSGIADSIEYKENYDKIKIRPLDINTKGEFPNVV